MPSPLSATSILKRDAELLDAFLRQVLDAYRDPPTKLLDAIEYSLFAGGKRLRPTLVIETWRACGGSDESQQAALAGAAGIELVHTFSLIHDDLPAMDDDDLRRGRPTNHKVFGEALAILAGDAILSMAFEVISKHAPAQVAVQMIREVADATGAGGMIGGQVLDISSEHQALDLEQLKQIHGRKTGSLLRAACRIGAIAAGADDSRLQALTTFSEHLGLAFQIVDDLLDVTSSTERVGKATQKDRERGKNTFPALIGIDASRAEAAQQLSAATSALAPLGAKAASLRALAEFVVARES